MGVASFTPDQSNKGAGESIPVVESLLLDLLDGSLGQLQEDRGHVTSALPTHDVIKMIMTSEHPHLKQAVILSLPLLYAAVLDYWSPAPPSAIMDKLVLLVSSLLRHFNRY